MPKFSTWIADHGKGFLRRFKSFSGNIGTDVVGTLIGGALLSLAFTIWADNFHKVPDLNGRWRFESEYEHSDYSKYEGLRVYYQALLHQEGLKVRGSGEKVFEDFVDPTKPSRIYTGPERRLIRIQGYIKNNFWRRDTLVLHYWEEGGRRTSSTFHKLTHFDDDHMHGTFESTIANAVGEVTWDRKEFEDLPRSPGATQCEHKPEGFLDRLRSLLGS